MKGKVGLGQSIESFGVSGTQLQRPVAVLNRLMRFPCL